MARKTTKRKKTTTAKSSAVKPSAKTPETMEMNNMSEETETQDPVEAVTLDETAPANESLVKSMGKRELIDRVVEASGIKKKSVKPVVEAVLKELGDALHRGENLNLQPFGKGIVKTRKELENAEIVELRLRRSKLAITAAEAALDGDTSSDTSGDDDSNGPIADAAE
jgi:hypothetical protein